MMSKTREITNFFYGQYFADGVRIALGTLIPAVLFSYFIDIQVGTTVSLGAMMVGLADTPGPPSHRRNGMFVCLFLVLVTSLLTNLVNSYPVLLLIEIVLISFAYAMFAIFGARAATIGAMGTLALILNTDILEGNLLDTLEHSMYLFIGGLWYIILSSSFTQARPYRLAQQELGESIHKVATYIRIKSSFYDRNVDNDKNYLALIEQQVLVHEHQDNVRDLVFRSKRNIRDTTKIGRVLILIFTDIIDLFEQSMATHYDYNDITEKYGHTGILNDFKIIILRIANELDNLGYEINANKTPKPLYNFKDDLERLRLNIDAVEKDHGLNTLLLKKILINVRNLSQRIDSIYSYFRMEAKDISRKEEADYSKFVNNHTIDFGLLKENLTLESSTFRHAIRMAIVMGMGYIISQVFNVGSHSYWILLTIMVILKPGFGLTKQRNFQRLTGTIIGGIIGVLILLLIHDQTVRFVLLLLLIIATYSLIRINYIVSVMFMTPYVMIMFSFFEVNTFLIVQERVFDTLIGSALAFVSSYIIFPNWESHNLHRPMRKLLIANYNYIGQALHMIAGNAPDITQYKLARKEVYITTANMGSAFQRLITEPKNKQRLAKELNKFVVLNHILSSYSVTLLNNVRQADTSALTGAHVKLIRKTLYMIAQTIKMMATVRKDNQEGTPFVEVEVNIPEDLDDNNMDSEELRLITEQLTFLNRIAVDLNKVSEKFILDMQKEHSLEKIHAGTVES